MSKHVILTLTYDLGEYEDEALREMDPAAWQETFYQSDVFTCDMNIVGVNYVDKPATREGREG
jgi:hypothetical protein